MDLLMEIADEALLQVLLMAKRHRRSLNEEMLHILERAACSDPFRAPLKRKPKPRPQ
jgi:hypothetical protein